MAQSELDGMLDYWQDITTQIKKRMGLLVRELEVVKKMGTADENAEKAWKMAQALDARLAKMADALKRSAGHLKDL